MVWMGNGVENRSMVAYDKANAQWELGSLMRPDKLRDNMGCLMPTTMRNHIRQNHIIMQLKLKKQFIYNYCAIIP
jgi:hypothetical protein